MKRRQHLLVIDPIAFEGGSKIATSNILRLLDTNTHDITILTADRNSWKDLNIKCVNLYQLRWLSKQNHGLKYFLKHLFIALNVLVTHFRCGPFNTALGASGPGIDLALYIVKPLLSFRLIQLVHGSVATSRTLGRCLNNADEVHYLESTHASLISAISRSGKTPDTIAPPRFQVMHNGLAEHSWPKRCQYELPVIFWAASLLKWKGLDLLIEAFEKIGSEGRPQAHICYIRPKETLIEVSTAPVDMHAVHWHEKPENLDNLRAASNIFVSTSTQEPFGLSILEAMAAGHCVVIPEDGSYWDRTLENGINCIKYIKNDSTDLSIQLLMISQNMDLIQTLGNEAAKTARFYSAATQYAPITSSLQVTSFNGGSSTDPVTKKELSL